MFNIASEETYQDGQVIIKEGTTGDWVYVVLSGSVEISKTVEGKNQEGAEENGSCDKGCTGPVSQSHKENSMEDTA